MIINVDEGAAIALALLEEKIHNWQKTVPPSWPSTWPVFNRLIERHDEMALVYTEMMECILYVCFHKMILSLADSVPGKLPEQYETL